MKIRTLEQQATCAALLFFLFYLETRKYMYNLKQQQNVDLPDYIMEHFFFFL